MQISHSKNLESFLDFLRSCSEEYKIQSAVQDEEEKRTQDLLHKLELDQLTYHEAARTARLLTDTRRRRRYAKDVVEELEPIVNYILESQSTIRALERLLGDMRKIENKHRNRFYVPKCTGEN